MKENIAELVRELYAVRDKLVEAAADRGLSNLTFTLDGKLVGDIGELYAVEHYGLNLLPPGTSVHDCEAPNGVKIQVKTTQKAEGTSIDSEPEHLIVLLLNPDGSFKEIYNGAGSGPWREATLPDKKGLPIPKSR